MTKKKRKKGKIENVIERDNGLYQFYLEDSNKQFSSFNEKPGKIGEHIDFNYVEKQGEDRTFYNVTDINSTAGSREIKTADKGNGINNQEKLIDTLLLASASVLCAIDGETDDSEVLNRYDRLKTLLNHHD